MAVYQGKALFGKNLKLLGLELLQNKALFYFAINVPLRRFYELIVSQKNPRKYSPVTSHCAARVIFCSLVEL